LPEGGNEQAISFPKLAADPGARGVEERSGGPLGMLRTIEGMLSQDRRRSERLVSRTGTLDRGLLFDLTNQVEGASSPDVLRQMLPAGERRKIQVSRVAYWRRSKASPRLRAAYSRVRSNQ
jgi:hypothetical protein